ncbi:zinc-dependent alcohol dehydrogenase [Peribacillus glennii]|uniref:Alcohol dehydrogenase n=1 Tax=Peribacillus glennii TaxID=2303991 RepID=A0A372LFH1_9BACI|nr:alcohol dehydrogenase catalytic domain-containing protein [Peribacillus glennii]RFU64819.1 hypothetical protein D0466_02530 [Peribacillus glennii]
MIAAIKTEHARKIVLKEVPAPHLVEGEVLIKVEYCGVCGSDLHAYTHAKGYEFVEKPIILGHEISGIVVDCYDSSLERLNGKNVVVESMHYCNECSNCRDGRFSICEKNQVIGLHFNGGMAQFVKTKAEFVRVIPEGFSLRTAALSEPMSIAVHAVKKAGEIKENQVVLVQGPGIIGFFVGLVCIKKGAKVFISGLEQDDKNRLSQAPVFGMIPQRADRDLLDQKVDTMFECSGSGAAVKTGISSLKKGGKAVFVALYEQPVSLFLTDLVRNEWPIITSYGCDPSDYSSAFEILKEYEKQIETIISYYPLSEINQAFQDSFKQEVLKPVLVIDEAEGGIDCEFE